MKHLLPILIFFNITLSDLKAQEIREFMDLQTHATMNVAYPFFGNGLTWILPGHRPKVSHKHIFRNVIYADYLANNSGSRIVINGAIAAERAFTRRQAKRLILKQINNVNEFVANNSEHFAVARTPEEVRFLVHNTHKTIFIHSIEGARKLIRSAEDAKFWADQGVAFITLIHLFDDEFGGAALNPGFLGKIINPRGSLRSVFHFKTRRGLTPLGKNAIKWIADAGMLVDLTHMSPASKDDALEVMSAEKIPPLLTHSMFKPIQNHHRGISTEQLVKVYQLGGLFSTPINGEALVLHHADRNIYEKWNEVNRCTGSIDSYKFTYDTVQEVLERNISNIFNLSERSTYNDLFDHEKTQLSVGWQSDFNGWTHHSKPRYGHKGCYPLPEDFDIPLVDTVGLAHPGLLPQYWEILEKEGMRVDSLKRASEKFLQIWSQVRSRRCKGTPSFCGW